MSVATLIYLSGRSRFGTDVRTDRSRSEQMDCVISVSSCNSDPPNHVVLHSTPWGSAAPRSDVVSEDGGGALPGHH